MDKTHFYQRLMRWQHLRFNDVIVRERPETPAWDKKYEIYIQDKSRTCAQLYIRTTQGGENITQVREEYLRWLNEYHEHSAPDRRLGSQENAPLQRARPGVTPHRGARLAAASWPHAVAKSVHNVQH
ncbi:hypothetical protein [Erwinia sp. ErVv1]|uniref:hypothetical protein n=1 Tax=Erwinia sp. ErVv1 TaxID=1603299 RepID=UPI000B3150D9|nr:hypothetical protein [Erwinia sp. ErVv1]